MTVKKKAAAQKQRPAKKMSAVEHAKALKKNSEVIQNADLHSTTTSTKRTPRPKETTKEATEARDKVIDKARKDATPDSNKRVDVILSNDFVQIETTGVKLELDPLPTSALKWERLMEYEVPGTHIRLIGPKNPNDELTTEERVIIAKRLNEVGPKLPRYIKTVHIHSHAYHSKNDPDNSGHETAVANAAKEGERAPGVVRAKKQRETREPKATIPGGVPLKKICAMLNVDPKLARRILRSSGAKPGGRWEWSESEVEDIKKAIKAGIEAIEGAKDKEKIDAVDSTIKATTSGGGK